MNINKNENREPLMLSVFMITYNHEKLIAEAIEGILMQKTNFAFEVVISNDASTDNTDKIVQSYLKKSYPKITFRYFDHKENIGMSKNIVFTLRQCKGKYIALCEGDDYWTDPLKLRKQVDFLEANPAIVCHCHNAKILENGALTDFYSIPFSRELSRRTLINKFGIPTASNTFRNIFEDNMPDYLERFGIDTIIYFALASHGNFYFSDEFMSVYRMHPGGIWTGQTKQKQDKNLIRLQEYILNNLPLDDNEREDVNENIITIKQKRIKHYANKFHFGFTYFADVFYLMGAKVKGKRINLNFLLYLMFPEAITSFLKRSPKSNFPLR